MSIGWCSVPGRVRELEARTSAALFLKQAKSQKVVVKNFRDGFFPYEGAQIKEFFEEIKKEFNPDLIFTHYRTDRHQDHRTISDLTWNTWRQHLVLEYEIPKYDGDLGSPNCFVPLTQKVCSEKIKYICEVFQTQGNKAWLTPDTFQALLRLRGVECAAPDDCGGVLLPETDSGNGTRIGFRRKVRFRAFRSRDQPHNLVPIAFSCVQHITPWFLPSRSVFLYALSCPYLCLQSAEVLHLKTYDEP